MPSSPTDVKAPSLALTLTKHKGALEPARLAVLAFIAEHALAAEMVYRLELVLEELFINYVLHARAPPGHDSLKCTLRVDNAAVVLDFDDEALPFDPMSAPLPMRGTLEDMRPGGMGLRLIRGAATSWEYARINEHNLLTVRLVPAGATSATRSAP